MRSILESIHASMGSNQINEGKFKNVVVTYDHEDPSYNQIFTDVDNADIKWAENLAPYYCTMVLKNPSNIIMINHDDESGDIVSVGNTVSDMKSKALKDIKTALKQAKDDGYEEGDNLLIETPMVGGLDIEYSPSLTPEKVYNMFIDYINDSYIDGDSSSAISIFDLTKKDTIYGRDMDFHFYDSFAEYKAGFE